MGAKLMGTATVREVTLLHKKKSVRVVFPTRVLTEMNAHPDDLVLFFKRADGVVELRIVPSAELNDDDRLESALRERFYPSPAEETHR